MNTTSLKLLLGAGTAAWTCTRCCASVGLVIPGLAVALLLVFLRGQTPANPLFTLRFVASRASLTRAARLHDGTLQGEPQWTGLFRINCVKMDALPKWSFSREAAVSSTSVGSPIAPGRARQAGATRTFTATGTSCTTASRTCACKAHCRAAGARL